MNEKWYALVGAYLRTYWRFALVQALFAAIFWAVLSLYGAPAEAALYAAGLCALAGLGLLIVHFVRYLRKRRARQAAKENLTVSGGALPPADTPGEAEFRDMAQRVRRQYADLAAAREAQRRETLDWFTAWVHQIKTPIAVMQMTLQAEDTPEHRALEAELFRVRQYADLALSYLRLDEGGSDLVIRSVALDGVIRQTVRKYAPLFVRKRLALRYDGTDVSALTDEKWLAFILEQLLSNAVKYTASGGVTIAVSAEEKILAIADTGIGIAAEDLPRVFEKGYTGYNGRTDKAATGLGLYLCRRAAEMLHHRLWVQSEPGRGSTFFLDLHSDKLEVE